MVYEAYACMMHCCQVVSEFSVIMSLCPGGSHSAFLCTFLNFLALGPSIHGTVDRLYIVCTKLKEPHYAILDRMQLIFWRVAVTISSLSVVFLCPVAITYKPRNSDNHWGRLASLVNWVVYCWNTNTKHRHIALILQETSCLTWLVPTLIGMHLLHVLHVETTLQALIKLTWQCYTRLDLYIKKKISTGRQIVLLHSGDMHIIQVYTI